MRSSTLALPRRVEHLMDGRLLLSTGENVLDDEQRVSEPFKTGLTVAVTLQGRMTCSINGAPPVDIAGPAFSLILADAPHRRDQVFAGAQRLRYILVHMSPELVGKQLGLSFAALLEAGGPPRGKAPAFIIAPADRRVRSVASQLLVCPVRGATRPLYVTGKSFELVALAVEHCTAGKGQVTSSPRLSAAVVEKVTAARSSIVADPASTVSVAQLAASVGLSTKLLVAGFHHVFDTTVAGFIQEHRLQTAYRLISSGEASVAEAAYRIGYTPTYLSTLCKGRYGLAPSALRPH